MKTIKAKLRTVFALLSFIVLAIVLFTLWVAEQQVNDGRIINLSARQRMLIQKMTKEAVFVAHDSREDAALFETRKNALINSRDIFDRTLKGLIHGDEKLGLPELNVEGIKDQLLDIEENWFKFRNAIDKGLVTGFLPGDKIDHLKYIVENSEMLLMEMDLAVRMFENELGEKVVLLQKILLLFLSITLITIVFAWIMTNSEIVRPLEKTVVMIEELNSGNLNCRLDIESESEIGQMAVAFNSTLENFQRIIGQMGATADHLASATTELHASTERNSGQADLQTKKVTATLSSIDEVNMAICRVATHAVELAGTAVKTSGNAEAGGKIIGMSVKAIEKLSDYSSQIDKILLVIEDIAKKTDLLAINAAIEAANAGDQGKGFAVVADEVRKLAERTTRATREINSMIKDIQTHTQNAVTSMKHSSDTMEKIIREAAKVNTKVDQIVSATEFQTDLTNKMLESVREVNDLSKGFSVQAKETKQVAGDINDQSFKLQQIVDLFNADLTSDS